jgi:hypothetical protein
MSGTAGAAAAPAAPQPTVWPYSQCKHLYGGRTPAALAAMPPELATMRSRRAAADAPPPPKVLVHTSSRAVVPLCLHAAEVADVGSRPSTLDDGEPVPPPFESAALGYVEPVQHTMAYALPSYCFDKVPLDNLHRAIQRDERFCVWGIFDSHLHAYAWERGFVATQVNVHQKAKKDPVLNRERPRLFYLQHIGDLSMAAYPDAAAAAAAEAATAAVAAPRPLGGAAGMPARTPRADAEEAAPPSSTDTPAFTMDHIAPFLGPDGCVPTAGGSAAAAPTGARRTARGFYVLTVYPSSDYVNHYARMVHQSMETMKRGSAATLLEVRRFPLVEELVPVWTQLGAIDIRDSDLVVMGHVRDYHESLAAMDAEWPAEGDAVAAAKFKAAAAAAAADPLLPARGAHGAAAAPNLTDAVRRACRDVLADALRPANVGAATGGALSGEATGVLPAGDLDCGGNAPSGGAAATGDAPMASAGGVAPWWRLFEPPSTVGDEAFQPPHEREVRRLAETWTGDGHIGGAPWFPVDRSHPVITMDFLLALQQQALRNAVPEIATQVLRTDSGEVPTDRPRHAPGMGSFATPPARTLTQTMADHMALDDGDLSHFADVLPSHLTLPRLDAALKWSNYGWASLDLAHADCAQSPASRSLPIKRILFLGVRYSYWGNGIAPIVQHIYSKTQVGGRVCVCVCVDRASWVPLSVHSLRRVPGGSPPALRIQPVTPSCPCSTLFTRPSAAR